MPQLNRRRFLQVASAASLTPTIAGFPASAAAAPSGATSAQMLWASLFNKAGNAANFGAVTRTMGISGQAAIGVHAELIRTSALATNATINLGRAARRPMAAKVRTATPTRSIRRRSIKVDVKRLLSDDIQEELELVEHENTDELTDSEKPE